MNDTNLGLSNKVDDLEITFCNSSNLTIESKINVFLQIEQFELLAKNLQARTSCKIKDFC